MSIYSDAEGIILARRKNSLERVENLYDGAMKDKRFLQIEKDINVLSPILAKARVENNEKKIKESEREIDELNKKKTDILKKLNINSLEPNFYCTKCNDTGYLDSKACACLRQVTFDLLLKQCGISAKKLADFSSFNENLFGEQKEQMKVLKEKMIKFCEDFPNTKKKCLLFLGQSGTGKTFTVDCITQRLLQRGYTVFYVTAFSLNNMFLKYHTTFDDSKNLYMDNLLECDVLIIDDLGTEPILRNVTQEYLYSVINERKLMNKTNIISTNLTLNEALKRYEERTASRIYDKNTTYVINMPNENLRNKQSRTKT